MPRYSTHAHLPIDNFNGHRNEPAPTRPTETRPRIDRERRPVHCADDPRILDEKLPRRVVEIAPRVRALVVVREHAIAETHQDEVEAAGRRRHVRADCAAVGDVLDAAQRAARSGVAGARIASGTCTGFL